MASTNDKFPPLCIPRAMTFQTAEFVEIVFNRVMTSKRGHPFVKKVEMASTTDKNGNNFNCFFIHVNQEFNENDATTAVYKALNEKGFVNIATGKGAYFWKVKLYIPRLKEKHFVKKSTAPRIMTEEDDEEFLRWRKERAAAKAAKAQAEAEKPKETGAWGDQVEGDEEGEIIEDN
jgi:hypothetical protein